LGGKAKAKAKAKASDCKAKAKAKIVDSGLQDQSQDKKFWPYGRGQLAKA